MKISSFLRKHRIAAGISGIVLLLILIVLSLAVSTTTMLPRPEIGPGDWMRQGKITMHVMQEVFRCEPEERVTMTFSEQDIRTMLRFAVNQDQIRGIFSGRNSTAGVPFQVTYADGRFTADWIAWPDAGPFRFILHLKARITYADNHFLFKDASGSIGRMPVPQFILQPVIRNLLRKAEQDPGIRNFHPAVESISVTPENGLMVDFRPHLLRDAVRESFSL